MRHKPKVQTLQFAVPLRQIELTYSNEYWSGLERLRGAENVLASALLDEEKQQKLAKLFGPDQWSLEVKGTI